MKRLVLALIPTLALAGIALAGPVEDREAIMKERAGITGQLSKVAKGEVPFDAAAALTLLQQMQANADKTATGIDTLWADGTEGGEASPKIWQDKAGFKAATDKFKADVDAAVAAPPADLAALQASFGGIAKNCGACHELYRVKKD